MWTVLRSLSSMLPPIITPNRKDCRGFTREPEPARMVSIGPGATSSCGGCAGRRARQEALALLRAPGAFRPSGPFLWTHRRCDIEGRKWFAGEISPAQSHLDSPQ